jgi:hypothetical protein
MIMELFSLAPTQIDVNCRYSQHFGQFQNPLIIHQTEISQLRDISQNVHRTMTLLKRILRTCNFDNPMVLVT